MARANAFGVGAFGVFFCECCEHSPQQQQQRAQKRDACAQSNSANPARPHLFPPPLNTHLLIYDIDPNRHHALERILQLQKPQALRLLLFV
jgi:hypothetical protein